uniref:Aminopeptidase O (putative) n=1 Tax=Fundulus heteroclitus TaxID=8078 RepID=A0A3Q2QWW8_FUNHE
METDGDLNPDTDDLPLRANTSHILVRHYALDLSVHFDKKIISGSVVLFLEPRSAGGPKTEDDVGSEAGHCARQRPDNDGTAFESPAEGSRSSGSADAEDFTLVLDCCDLDVSKVEEVDVDSVSAPLGFPPKVASEDTSASSRAAFIQHLLSMPSARWREKHRLFSLCGRGPVARNAGSLGFHTDRWSLQVRKAGVKSPQSFPRIIRIHYVTRPLGGSVRWTKDQDNRECVYTAGSPINNRALFPCQEPPVAMSTWQARVRAPSDCVVLMSGDDQAAPAEDGDTHFLIWNYYVTMPMPASTFTLAVGHWRQVPAETPSAPGKELSLTDYSGMVDDGISCSHGDYPCRFAERSAWSQRVVPHRVFSPVCLLQKAQMGVLKLLPQCLAAAHAVLGVHPFPRLDVLIVPAGFSSLGMASPHLIFLSQSVLCEECPSGLSRLSLSGSRLCHEIAHSWFGLVIGARDWTEEWISEGFATFLEDIIWALAQQLSLQQTAEQFDLKALLRWRRLSDELQNSKEELQILRPNMERTGQVCESGSSMVKHGLNPDKTFMQVHYLKGYFLLRFLASEVGDQQLTDFFRLFVKKYHGQLVLSQVRLRFFFFLQYFSCIHLANCFLSPQLTADQLVMLLELLLEESELSVSSMRALQKAYSLQKQDAEVRHRWCELVVKHAYSQAYCDVEHFLVHDQAMGVYLYGELMVQEDPEQQALARRCLALVQEEMDQSARSVVEEMIL